MNYGTPRWGEAAERPERGIGDQLRLLYYETGPGETPPRLEALLAALQRAELAGAQRTIAEKT